MPRFLVTGGAGFIGSNIVHELVGRGESVRVLDDLSTGHMANLDGVLDSVEFIKGSAADADAARAAAKGVEVVLHQGALGSVPRSVKDPKTSNHANVTGTLTMLVAARDAGVRRFIFASSSSVYGANPVQPRTEDLAPMPQSPYAASKLAAESYVRVFAQVYGMETVSLRYFNIYGPRQRTDGPYAAVVPVFTTRLLAGEACAIYGDGLQSRDFTFVSDCVRANLLAAEAPAAKVAGETFNVAAGNECTVNKLFDMIRRAVGSGPEAVHEPDRPGDARRARASVEKAARGLGFKAEVRLEEGIRRTVEFIRGARRQGPFEGSSA
jgi:nucleoside-diphosphate-sugar epimerase